MKKMTAIVFTLSNWEKIRVDWKYIKNLDIQGISNNISNFCTQDIVEYLNTKDFAIEISSAVGERILNTLDSDYSITDIELEWIENNIGWHKDFSVTYKSEERYLNMYQRNYSGIDGNMFIVVSESKALEYFYPNAKIFG